MNTIKDCIDLISIPLTHLVNLSISSGIFPDQLKIARIVPIFKTGDRQIFSNYRPNSILPIFSKVFEKIVSIRLINYMDRLHILVDNQFGFRSGHSTSLALLQLYNKISSAIDLNEFTIGIFLDLSKAFDTDNFMIFRPRQKKFHINPKIVLNSFEIAMVDEVSFLGVILYANLTWKSHISHVSRKMSKSIGIIKKASFCLPSRSLISLYYALVYPYMQYCILVWGSTYPSTYPKSHCSFAKAYDQNCL